MTTDEARIHHAILEYLQENGRSTKQTVYHDLREQLDKRWPGDSRERVYRALDRMRTPKDGTRPLVQLVGMSYWLTTTGHLAALAPHIKCAYVESKHDRLAHLVVLGLSEDACKYGVTGGEQLSEDELLMVRGLIITMVEPRIAL